MIFLCKSLSNATLLQSYDLAAPIWGQRKSFVMFAHGEGVEPMQPRLARVNNAWSPLWAAAKAWSLLAVNSSWYSQLCVKRKESRCVENNCGTERFWKTAFQLIDHAHKHQKNSLISQIECSFQRLGYYEQLYGSCRQHGERPCQTCELINLCACRLVKPEKKIC